MHLTISVYFTRFQLIKFKPILKRRKESQVLLVTLFVYPHMIHTLHSPFPYTNTISGNN